MDQKPFYTVFNSARLPIVLPEGNNVDEHYDALVKNQARWLGVGELHWDKTDDVAGDRDVQNIKRYIKLISDVFGHKAYKCYFDENGLETHEYTHRKQNGIVEMAALVRHPDAVGGWARKDFIGGNRSKLFFFQDRNTKTVDASGTVTWQKTKEAPVFDAVIERHELVSYMLLSGQFKGIRVQLPPFLYAYLAVFQEQWLDPDDEHAWETRAARIAAAREYRNEIRPVISKHYNAPGAKNIVGPEDRKPIIMETLNGLKVDLWKIPDGTYDLAYLGRVQPHGQKLVWHPEATPQWQASAMAEQMSAFTLVYPKL